MSFLGQQYDLLGREAIYQGADWEKEFQFTDPTTNLPYDLTGYVARSHARKSYQDLDPTITFSCTIESNGIVKLSLNNTVTSAIPKGMYTYDVELVEPSPSTVVHKAILPSQVEVIEEYTK